MAETFKKAPSVVLIGGSGRLGRAIASKNEFVIAPTSRQLNIISYKSVRKFLHSSNPDVVILSAALVGRKECEAQPQLAQEINTGGTRNVALVCKELKIKLVFTSSSAVFDGRKGNYCETDKPNPRYFYAETKLEAEQIVSSLLGDYLIIRTDFFDPSLPFKYEKVFRDHYCSREPTLVIAEKILQAIEIGARGILHIGGSRKSLYDALKPFFPRISPIAMAESTMPDFPRDLSLCTELFRQKIAGKIQSSLNHGELEK